MAPKFMGGIEAFLGERLHQLAADGDGQLAFVVDDDLHLAAGHQPRAGCENDEYEYQDDRRKQRHTKGDLGCAALVQS